MIFNVFELLACVIKNIKTQIPFRSWNFVIIESLEQNIEEFFLTFNFK